MAIGEGSDWLSAIGARAALNRAAPSRAVERDLLAARREAFLTFAHGPPVLAEPDFSRALPISLELGLPANRGAVDTEVVRATIRKHGSIVVKQLLSPDVISSLRRTSEATFAERDRVRAGALPATGNDWYSEFPQLRESWHREFTYDTGGLLAVDSPRALFQWFEALSEAGLLRLASEYLGTRPAFSAEKTVLRRVGPEHAGPPDCGFHQDGSFMKTDDRVLNIWVSLTPCGQASPSLELLPRRVDRILENENGHLTLDVLEREYPDESTVLAQFEPGDVVLFDHMCVHRSGHAPGMTEHRLAFECWTFAPDNVPSDYTGLVL